MPFSLNNNKCVLRQVMKRVKCTTQLILLLTHNKLSLYQDLYPTECFVMHGFAACILQEEYSSRAIRKKIYNTRSDHHI